MKVYFCYNQSDKTSALYLIQKLKQQSIEIWIDVEQMVAGDRLYEKIEEGLNNSHAIIVCVGKNEINERQNTEISAALQIQELNKSFRIIPILLPGSNEGNLPFFLRSFSRIDFSNNLEDKEELENLIKALKDKDFQFNKSDKIKVEIPKKDKPENKRAVSVAILVKDEILIVQRAKTQRSGEGLWQIPGGKVKKDETPIQAAMREIDEEVGIIIEKGNLIPITDLVDTWVINNTDDYITMSLFLAVLTTKKSVVADEFQNSKWIKISDLFSDNNIIYFGSTNRYLRIIRRFITLYLPLKEISDCILNNNDLPIKLKYLSVETSQTLYSILALLGFLDDKEKYSSSSTLSGNLIKMLSEWSLTESVIFEADGDRKWQDIIGEQGDIEEVEKFRAGLFDEHKNLLGLLSHKLPKVLSTRHVCDILLTAVNPINLKMYLLIRWDLLASKFQIPAKGLEDLNTSASSIEAPKYVVKERLNENLIEMFEYKFFHKLNTSHIGAGSLGDGPILRNFIITIFNLYPIDKYNDEIIDYLNQINKETINLTKEEKKLGDPIKRALNFFVWVELDYLELKKRTILSKKLQGYEEIVNEFGIDFIKNYGKPILLNQNNQIPIIGCSKTENHEQLDFIIKEY